jgi:hypothetical protein
MPESGMDFLARLSNFEAILVDEVAQVRFFSQIFEWFSLHITSASKQFFNPKKVAESSDIFHWIEGFFFQRNPHPHPIFSI